MSALKRALAALASLGLVLGVTPGGLAAVGVIGATVAPSGPLDLGQTVTVTLRISDYPGGDEIDGCNCLVRYDASRWAFVPGSFQLGAASGPDRQWLSLPNQESAAQGYALATFNDADGPGLILVSLFDLGVSSPERGTVASAGFLASFQLTATSPGASRITPEPYLDGSVLFDTAFLPAGLVAFTDAAVTVRNPVTVAVQVADGTAAEPGADTAAFLLARFGPTNMAVTVRYTLGGSAEAGRDYAAPPGVAVIPAGAAGANVPILPLDDAARETTETVTLTLLPDAAYDLVPPDAGTVTILDNDNQAPAVALTQPTPGRVFTTPASLTLAAAATDPDGNVARVEFFADGTNRLGESLAPPYALVWGGTPPGSHTLTAVATDDLGRQAVSAPVSVFVNQPPVVTIVHPPAGVSFAAPAHILIGADAVDGDGQVRKVEFYAGATLLRVVTNAPYTMTWSNVPAGTYAPTARATDERGATAVTAPVAVSVHTPGLRDHFAGQDVLRGDTHYLTGNTAFYTRETGEPRHASRAGDHSGWVTWVAPRSSVYSLDTFGSSFDTVLAVYTNAPGATPALTNLILVVANDDADSRTVFSRVAFNSIAGESYHIAVDAYAAGQGGSVVMSLGLATSLPVFTLSPLSRLSDLGGSVTFTAAALGAAPLTYQWRFNGANLPGETNGTLTIPMVQAAHAGAYDVRASNGAGTASSAVATLTVIDSATRVTRIRDAAAAPGATVTVPVELLAQGGENLIRFSASFDPALLNFLGAAPGDGAGLAALTFNTTQLASGRIGCGVALGQGLTFAPGTQELARLTFQVTSGPGAIAIPLALGDQPVARQVLDLDARGLGASYQGGTVTTGSALEGDLLPLPYGNGVVTIADWVKVGRYAAGLDSATNALQFQRADCAPRGTLGNGAISIADWVQVGRYSVGLDPATSVGGPVAPAGAGGFRPASADGCVVSVAPGPLVPSRTNVWVVQVLARGGESAFGMSITFDPAALAFISALPGGGMEQAALNVNAAQAPAGRLGLGLSLPIGTSLAAGTHELARIRFSAAPAGIGITTIRFADEPVGREVSDASATALAAGYVDGVLGAGARPLRLQPLQRLADGGFAVVVANADGTAVDPQRLAMVEVLAATRLSQDAAA